MQKENKAAGTCCGDCIFNPICPHSFALSDIEQCRYFTSKSLVEENRVLLTENVNLKMQIRRLIRELSAEKEKEKQHTDDATQEEKPFGWYFYE